MPSLNYGIQAPGDCQADFEGRRGWANGPRRPNIEVFLQDSNKKALIFLKT